MTSPNKGDAPGPLAALEHLIYAAGPTAGLTLITVTICEPRGAVPAREAAIVGEPRRVATWWLIVDASAHADVRASRLEACATAQSDESEPVCEYCGGATCAGDCDGYYDRMADDIDARYETWRDREID